MQPVEPVIAEDVAAAASAEDAAGGDVASAPQAPPPPPSVPQSVREQTQRLLAEVTAPNRDYTDAVRQYARDVETLFPFDELTRKRGRGRSKREQDRTVRVPMVLRNAQQTLAMVCPYRHDGTWKPADQVPPDGDERNTDAGDPLLMRFGTTLTMEVRDEIKRTGTTQAIREWVSHAIWFRVGILKITYQREFLTDPLMVGRVNDLSDNIARLQELTLRAMRGEITEQDAEWQDKLDLEEQILAGAELRRWEGIRAEVVPLTRFKMDPRVKSFARVYDAGWHDFEYIYRRSEVAARFPFHQESDGSWSGVHHQDLLAAMTCDEHGTMVPADQRPQPRQVPEAKPGAEQSDDDPYILVHERWDLRTGTVYWLVDGVPYPLDTWIPDRQPAQWYPTHLLILNDDPMTWYGRSDTELQGPVQARWNRKASDEELQRWLSLARLFATDAIDKPEDFVLQDPGMLKVLAAAAGKSISEILQVVSIPYNPAAFDRQDDERSMRSLARVPEQTLGVTDGRTTATAIQAANAGSAVATSDKQEVVRAALGRVRESIAQILMQERRPEEVLRRRGRHALWPRIYSDREAQQLRAQIDAQVHQTVTNELMALETDAAMQGLPASDPDPVAVDQRIAELTEQLTIEATGMPVVMSRHELYEGLTLDVDISVDSQADAMARFDRVVQLLQAVGQTGATADPERLSRLVGKIMREERAADSLFVIRPDELAARLIQAVQGGKPLSPEAMQALIALLAPAAAAPPPGPGTAAPPPPTAPPGSAP